MAAVNVSCRHPAPTKEDQLDHHEIKKQTQQQLHLLDRVVLQLTQPHKLFTNTKTTTQQPLLDQLTEAIGSTNSSGRGNTLKHARAIIDFSALMLAQQINHEMFSIWKNHTNQRYPKNTKTALIIWHLNTHKTHPNLDLAALTQNTRKITRWAKTIQNKFDPPTILEISAPCPKCKQQKHQNQDEELTATLRVVWRTSFDDSQAECQNCLQTWTGENGMRQLRWLIDNHDTPKN